MTDKNPALPVLAWLGLGAVGLPMVQRVVAAGYRVRADDPHRERLDAAGTDRAHRRRCPGCAGPRRHGGHPQQGDEALVGRGALEALDPGARVVVLSTVGTAWVAQLAGRVRPGARVVDAPVSGGVVRARDGSLLVMASGLDAGSRTLLDPLGDVVEVRPDPGQGPAMKMVTRCSAGSTSPRPPRRWPWPRRLASTPYGPSRPYDAAQAPRSCSTTAAGGCSIRHRGAQQPRPACQGPRPGGRRVTSWGHHHRRGRPAVLRGGRSPGCRPRRHRALRLRAGAARLVEVVAPGALGRPTEQVHRLARADAGRVDA